MREASALELDRHSVIAPDVAGMPLYRAVKCSLLQRLERGDIAPGSLLPSETELARGFGVSIGTLRRAVDELVADSVLVRRQGRGTFLATHTDDRFLFQFFHVERQDGHREVPQITTLSFERTRLDIEAAEALALPEGEPAFMIENRLDLQRQAVVHDRLLLPAKLFKHLTERRVRERPSTLYHLYQSEFGITVLRAHERLRAAAADRSTARVLGVVPGAPILQVRRTAIALGGRAVEYRVSSIHTARHEYVNLLSRQA